MINSIVDFIIAITMARFVPDVPLNNATIVVFKADSWFAPSQWESALFCNAVSHLLGTSLESALVFLHYMHIPSLSLSPASFAALLILYASELAHVCVHVWLCALRRKGCRRDCIIAVAVAEGCYVRRFSGPAAVAMLSRWRLSVTICARMFYDTFVFNFGFYPLWWCMYHHWCLYFHQKDFMVMYSCTFTYECVFYYVLGQRWPHKQVKSINYTQNKTKTINVNDTPPRAHRNEPVNALFVIRVP